MLVLAERGDRGDESFRLEALFRSWTGGRHLSGFVLFDVPTKARPLDAVVVTPAGLVVVEIAAFRERQRGVLSAPASGGWRVGEDPAVLRGHADGEANPLRWLETDLLAVRNSLRAMRVDTGFVSGLVTVVPSFAGDIEVRRQGRLSRGAAVVLGEDEPLWRYFHRMIRGRDYWSVDDALAACTALGVGDRAPSRAELVRERFPQLARRVSTSGDPLPPITEPAAEDDYVPPVQRSSGRHPIPRHAVRRASVLLAVLLAAVLLAIVVHGLFHG